MEKVFGLINLEMELKLFEYFILKFSGFDKKNISVDWKILIDHFMSVQLKFKDLDFFNFNFIFRS